MVLCFPLSHGLSQVGSRSLWSRSWPCCAADGGTGGELRGRASLVTVDVLTGHICSISFCLYVPTERDKYVWLVESRRRPEKWTRTRKAGSRGSATPDPVSGSCVQSEKHHHKSTVADFFSEPLKPNTGKPCENSLKTHLTVLLFLSG